jgi:peptide/nickel transport system ATP-binding protein
VTALLRVEDLTVSYAVAAGRIPAVRGVSLTVDEGEVVAVVGESGSGKSTLARVLTGLLPAMQGESLLGDKKLARRLKDRTKEEKRRLQMIYQMPDVALNPRQKIEEVLGRPLSFYFGRGGEERKRRVKELLEWVELPAKFMDRYPGELSGGQKQRVCIARALAAEPTVIVCDEVTSALDPVVADGVLKLLMRIQKETALSYLFITHDLATVKAIADTIVVMYRGEVVAQGPKHEILNPPHHPYTDLLLSSVPEMDTGWLDRLLAERAERKARGERLMESAGA